MIDAIIPVQEIKRRGMSAVDSGLRQHGAVTVVRNNRPAYVILTPNDYEELARIADGARIKQALADWEQGRCQVTTVDKLMSEALSDD